jgi:tetratricopeptide (TPR) repeat protein
VSGFARLPPGCALLAGAILAAGAAEAEPCRITRAPDIPVIMRGLKPTVRAQINGQDAWLVADSGAFFNMLTPAAVAQFQLPYQQFPGLNIKGVGGSESGRVVRVRKFTFIGTTWDDVDFIVAGSGFGGDAVGILGQSVLRIADVEYDLGNGVIRLVKPKGDCKHTNLAYWADAANKPYSVIDIEPASTTQPHTRSIAYLNGVKIRVMFDTGASHSLLTLGAAKEAGTTPATPGVTDGGHIRGLGHGIAHTWITRFSSFKIGDEEIQHAELRFGDVNLLDADMLIGADFFLSHRVYVATSQNRLYFTYNGGPVFDLSAQRTPAEAAGAAAGTAASSEVSQAPAPDAALRLDQPTDAAGFARRGAASDGRHDYDAAIADLTRACELAPTESSYFYQRGLAHWHKGQGDAALADFDQAIKLKPDNADALIDRAALRVSRQAPAGEVIADLNAAGQVVPPQAEVRLRIGDLYESAGQPAAAAIEYSKWIDSHPRDNMFMPRALSSRCRGRALSGLELQQALGDCNAALRMKPNTVQFLDSRGLVHLRQNDYDRAIADYDAALHQQPNLPWSLYGRGLAKLRKGLTAEGQADIAAAIALEPKIAQRAATYGITP